MNRDINFSQHLYERLPEVYRREDSKKGIDYALKRYLEALDEGGVSTVFGELLSLYDILEIEKCPPEVLPLLSKMLGYNYIEEVDVNTQRKIVSNLIELYKRKGTKSVVKFIAREFTKFESEIVELQYRLFKTWSPNPKGIPQSDYVEPRTLGTKINTSTCHLFSHLGMYNYHGIIVICDATASQVEILNRLLREFLPVYCNLYLKLKDTVGTYFDSASVKGVDVATGLKISEIEENIKASLKDTVKVRYNTSETVNTGNIVSSKDMLKDTSTESPNVATNYVNTNTKPLIKDTDTTPVKVVESKEENTITIVDKENPKVSITFDFNNIIN